jgi:hypothetical protein
MRIHLRHMDKYHFMWYYLYIMTEIQKPFSQEIEENQTAELAPTSTIDISTESSSLSIRERGGFIVDCALTSGTTGTRHNVLFSDGDISVPKLTASHIMSPVGPSEGIGGQHDGQTIMNFH